MSLYRTLVGFSVLAVMLGWYLATRPTPEVSPEIEQVAPKIEESESSKASTSELNKDTTKNLTETKSTIKKVWPENPFPYQKDLDVFIDLKQKVLRADSDERTLKSLLTDASLLKAVTLRLTEASLAPSVLNSQDAAVDLLIEALKSGDREYASEMAKAVVEDPQVENPTLDPEVRTNLAGIKAEVMYHWTALVPEAKNGLENSLPGPVSRKIWANVAHRQASNLAEERGP